MIVIMAGSFVELYPKDRDTLRRVGIVKEDSNERGYFEAWYIATGTGAGKNFELYSVAHGSYNLRDEGKTFVRLDGPGTLAQGIGAIVGECTATVERMEGQ